MTRPNLVYVVDDDPSARKGLARLLRVSGYDVREFATANEFLEAFCSEESGCLVLDLRMPGLSGDELQKELKACGVQIPIIVVSAQDDPVSRRTAMEMNAVGFFRKPVDGMALLDAIHWALQSSTSTGQ